MIGPCHGFSSCSPPRPTGPPTSCGAAGPARGRGGGRIRGRQALADDMGDPGAWSCPCPTRSAAVGGDRRAPRPRPGRRRRRGRRPGRRDRRRSPRERLGLPHNRPGGGRRDPRQGGDARRARRGRGAPAAVPRCVEDLEHDHRGGRRRRVPVRAEAGRAVGESRRDPRRRPRCRPSHAAERDPRDRRRRRCSSRSTSRASRSRSKGCCAASSGSRSSRSSTSPTRSSARTSKRRST